MDKFLNMLHQTDAQVDAKHIFQTLEENTLSLNITSEVEWRMRGRKREPGEYFSITTYQGALCKKKKELKKTSKTKEKNIQKPMKSTANLAFRVLCAA